MGVRRRARELALQLLYEIEVKGAEPHTALEHFWESQADEHGGSVDEETRSFTAQLVDGVFRNRSEIDQMIEKHSHHWKLVRMALIDRNVLRIGVFELLYLHDVPSNVILNEAIEIAKKFGTGDSSSFINGILDKVAKEVRKRD